ncbi:MAG: hypothetical protein AB7G75_06165 [Candidatus Binatia bacterium]
MNPREQALTDDFKDNIAYERLVLTTLIEVETAYHGQRGAIIDLRSFPRKITLIGGASVRDQVIKEVVPRLRPLIFVAAYKILDLFVEFVLKLKGQTPPQEGWSFEKKKNLLANRSYQLPSILSPTDEIWDRMVALYTNLSEARHCVVHRRSNQNSDGTLFIQDRSGNALLPLTAQEQEKFAEATYVLSESVTRQEISNRQRNAILNALDYLDAHHRYPKTGMTVPGEIPQIIANLTPLSAGRWQLDIESIRNYLAETQPWAKIADIALHRPGEPVAAFSTRLEDWNTDMLEFSEGILPHGVRTP